MKQFIVLLAVLPLMLVFILQFALDQQIEYKRAIIDSLVYTAKEEARQDGCFTEENKDKLRRSIASSCSISLDDVYIDSKSNVKKRLSKASSDWENDLIHYEARVTLGAIMAGGNLLGIKESDNKYCYIINSYAASEKID